MEEAKNKTLNIRRRQKFAGLCSLSVWFAADVVIVWIGFGGQVILPNRCGFPQIVPKTSQVAPIFC